MHEARVAWYKHSDKIYLMVIQYFARRPHVSAGTLITIGQKVIILVSRYVGVRALISFDRTLNAYAEARTLHLFDCQGDNRLCDQLNDTTGGDDLLLSELGEPSGADDDWDVWETSLSEDLGVSEWEKVDNWEGVLVLALEVLLALLSWDEGPKL